MVDMDMVDMDMVDMGVTGLVIVRISDFRPLYSV